VLNELDRFHLLADVAERVPKLANQAAYLKQFVRDKLVEHNHYIRERGDDLPEVKNWKWPY
jgi:xylulose-5-phosphate/fructose-6-phosphate phosphoketolase